MCLHAGELNHSYNTRLCSDLSETEISQAVWKEFMCVCVSVGVNFQS